MRLTTLRSSAFTVVLLFISSVIVFHPTPLADAQSTLQIADSATTTGIGTVDSSPLDRTEAFLSSDDRIYSWILLSNVPPPTHNVTWVWITPQMNVYTTFTSILEDPGPGRFWTTYRTWTWIHVDGFEPSHMLGYWQIEVYLDGVRSLVQAFSISETATPLQPMYGFYWPNRDITVYIQPEPARVRQEVIEAMVQWNYSQAWFQRSYVLDARSPFNLVVSTDPSSNIKVTFNQTQTDPNALGYANFRWFFDSSRRVTTVTCSITMALTKMDGTVVNSAGLENLAQHELGHCLGLDHVERRGDTMNPKSVLFSDLHTPSTLNLYALSEISRRVNIDAVSESYSLTNLIEYVKSPRYTGQPVNGSLQIADHAAAKGVDSESFLPINRTGSFSVHDLRVYSWLKLANISRPSHLVTWLWFTPQGEEYAKVSLAIPDPGPGKSWPTYFAWHYIFIEGYGAAELPGSWKVEVYVDGLRRVIESFLLVQNVTSIGTSLNSFPVKVENATYVIYIRSNSTISSFNFSKEGKSIQFKIAGPAATIGSAEVTWPSALLSGNFTVTLDGSVIVAAPSQNSTHTTISLNYPHSERTLQITGTHVIPEFPVSSLIMVLTSMISVILRFLVKGPRFLGTTRHH
jgi:predicted Zn-dependent protease